MHDVLLVVVGWAFGLWTCLLYITIKALVEVKRRNRRAQQLLDAGMDVVREVGW